jgi:hypothetical protein
MWKGVIDNKFSGIFIAKFNATSFLVPNITIILGFSNWKFWSKKLDLRGEGGGRHKKTPYHFGQVNFNMFSVTKVIFY